MTANKVQMARGSHKNEVGNLTKMNAAAKHQNGTDPSNKNGPKGAVILSSELSASVLYSDKHHKKKLDQPTKQVAEAEDTRSATLIKFQRTMRRLMILKMFANKVGLDFHID